MINKLVEEWIENFEETKLVEKTSAKNENKHRCSSYILFIVLFALSFAMNIEIGIYFVYSRWYLKKDVYPYWNNNLVNL